MTDSCLNGLPEEFKDRMSELLGDEYDEFIRSYSSERTYGLRINPLKTGDDPECINRILGHIGIDASQDRIPWCPEGYYYKKDSCPGRSPFHEAGAYYIQEPSAMAVVTALDPRPGERICDLCAAPGGKTTHIAGRMKGEGVLVSNEYVGERARILSQNVERMGIRNCIVTNASPDELAARFGGYFDRVCVDAPCSGEGMFRKEEIAVSEWSTENVAMCSERQADILEPAAAMVRPGGVLVYSTCTFEPAENEKVISGFLRSHPEWRLDDTGLNESGLHDHGRSEWSDDGSDMSLTVRIWPHRSGGEGHFIARLLNQNGSPESISMQSGFKTSGEGMKKRNRNADFGKKNDALYDHTERFLSTELFETVKDARRFTDIFFGQDIGKRVIEKNGHIYILPEGITQMMLSGIRVLRPGLEIAEMKKDRLEPAHALAMSVDPELIHNKRDLSYDDAVRYLRGETVTVKDDGCNLKHGKWVVVCINGISLGWGKYVNGTLKNHYPKGLRRNTTL